MFKCFFLFKKNNRGQSFVEFAIALPILVLLVLGIIQFGFIFNAYIQVTSAAREGARKASLGEKDLSLLIGYIVPITDEILATNVDPRDIIFYVYDTYDNLVDKYFLQEDENIEITLPSGMIDENNRVERVEVKVPASVKILVPLGMFIGDTYSISAKSSMRIQVN